MIKKSIDIKALASNLNMSVTTVSRVLNGKALQYRISKNTERKVREAAEAYQYTPNQFARSLKMDKSETLGVIVPDLSNPFFAEIVSSIEIESKKHGFAVLIGNSHDDTQLEINLVNHFKARKADGLVVAPVGIESRHLEEMVEAGMPLVVVDRTFPNIPIPAVTSDNSGGAYSAAMQLLQNNHRRIACLQGLKKSRTNKERVEGFVRAMKEYEVTADEYIISGDSFSVESGYHQAKLLLQKVPRPTAFFTCNNLIALGVLKAVSELSLHIPDDLSLISFDEQAYSAFLNTPMTTIEQNKKMIGKLAVEKLVDQISGKKMDSDLYVTIETKLHLRDSIKKI